MFIFGIENVRNIRSDFRNVTVTLEYLLVVFSTRRISTETYFVKCVRGKGLIKKLSDFCHVIRKFNLIKIK